MSDILEEYFEALERLKSGKTVIMPKGARIANDCVSLEAGRKKGTIKKSRPIFAELIKAIDAAKEEESNPEDEIRVRLDAARAEVTRYRTLWEGALAREVSLLKQLWDERESWAKERAALAGGKVTPIFEGRANVVDQR